MAAILPLAPQRGLLVSLGSGAAGVALVGVIAMLVAAAWRGGVRRAARAVAHRLRLVHVEPIVGQLDLFLASIQAASGRHLALALVWSVFLWVLSGLASYLVLLAFEPAASWYVSVFVTSSVALGLGLPSPPSGAGVFEAAAVGALVLFGIAAESALAYAVTLHLVTFLIIAVFGVLGLEREGERLRDLADSAQRFVRALRSQPQV